MKAFKEIFQGLNSAYGQTVLSDVYSENGKQKTKSFYESCRRADQSNGKAS